jgi:hypothetical protein
MALETIVQDLFIDKKYPEVPCRQETMQERISFDVNMLLLEAVRLLNLFSKHKSEELLNAIQLINNAREATSLATSLTTSLANKVDIKENQNGDQ